MLFRSDFFEQGNRYVSYDGAYTVLRVYDDSILVRFGDAEPVVLNDLSYQARVVRRLDGDLLRVIMLKLELISANVTKQGSNSVYVIRLREEARRNKRVTYLGRKDMPCVYVGQTGKTVAERFADHLNGHKTNIRSYALELMPELYEKYNPLPSREQAEKVEAALGEWLFGQGYTVLGAH